MEEVTGLRGINSRMNYFAYYEKGQASPHKKGAEGASKRSEAKPSWVLLGGIE
jgi:hypothetical protein